MNNTAQYAGSALYGGTVDYCHTYLHFRYNGVSSYFYSSRIFNATFGVTQQHGDSPISSDPYGVCVCNESDYLNCSIKSYTFPRTVYPGEAFNISAVAVGQRSGVAHASILATVISGSNQSLCKPIESDRKQCITLTCMLHSRNQRETLNLTVQQSVGGSFYYDYHPPSITVSLLPCPSGFTLQHDPPYCDPLLVRQKMSCNINNSLRGSNMDRIIQHDTE